MTCSVSLYTAPSRMGVEIVSLSTASSMDVLGVSLSTGTCRTAVTAVWTCRMYNLVPFSLLDSVLKFPDCPDIRSEQYPVPGLTKMPMPEIVRYLNKGPGPLQAYLFWPSGTFEVLPQLPECREGQRCNERRISKI
jgi:hypothetical protein